MPGDATESRERFLLIARACDDDPAGRSAEARVGFVTEPAPGDIARYERAITDVFREGMGCEATRVAVAVLPWADDLDGDDDEEAGRG